MSPHSPASPSRYKLRRVLATFAALYPDPKTELHHENPWQLLVATILSAQCTDRRVNLITPRIFARYPDALALSRVSQSELEELIRDCGLFRTKARNLLATARIVAEEYGNHVPRDPKALMRLPGVGRKTANVVMANAFDLPALAVDTHVFRVSHRLGWAFGKTPEETERELTALLPKRQWNRAHHWLILHGRRVCTARRPACHQCAVAAWCPKVGVEPASLTPNVVPSSAARG